jgi:hypothetical protein
MKIYLSSTYRDLEAHRTAVAAVLRRMGHQPIGMEDYVAEGARPLDRCLADVAASDAYVGILAWRYGHVPLDLGAAPPAASTPSAPVPPLPPLTQLGQTSITEFEYRQAAATLGKPVLVFLLDPEADWPSTRFDAVSGDGGEGRQIARLRQQVAQQHVVGHFRTPQDLAGQVSAAIHRAELERWLQPYLVTRAVETGPGEPAALRMQRLLDWPLRFVPLTEDGRFVRVVDRQGLAEQIARMFVREQVSRALSTTR